MRALLSFSWLKKTMPRSLYGRAAMILIMPIVMLQLVVSIVFIQRHFEGVTRQMTANVVRELSWLMTQVNDAADMDAAQGVLDGLKAPLALEARLPVAAGSLTEGRLFYDLSGRVVTRELRAGLPFVREVDLATDDHFVTFLAESRFGLMQIDFSRRRVSASNPHQLLVLMIFTGLLMTVIAYIFLRNQVRPIRRLARAAEAFGMGQRVNYIPSGATEVRAAGGAFLAMRERIDRQIEQRTMMLSGVSHDLRTPLTRMKLALSLLSPFPPNAAPNPAQQGASAEELAAMADDIADMEHLIDGFLNFARGDAEDDIEVAFPEEILRAAAARAGRTGRAGRDVAVVVPPGDQIPGPVRLRPRAVGRALDNLIGNALRYGTQVRISLVPTRGQLCFRVEDNGPGIPKERRNEARKPFSRLDAARTLGRTDTHAGGGAGTGLGLAIALDIARTHGGSLDLGESADLGGLRADLMIAWQSGGVSAHPETG